MAQGDAPRVGRGARRVAQGRPRLTHERVGATVARVSPQGSLQQRPRLHCAASTERQLREFGPGIGVLGRREGGAQERLRLRTAIRLGTQAREPPARRQVVGIELERPSKLLLGLLQLSHRRQVPPEVVVPAVGVGREGHGALEASARLIGHAQGVEELAEATVVRRRARLAQGLHNARHRARHGLLDGRRRHRQGRHADRGQEGRELAGVHLRHGHAVAALEEAQRRHDRCGHGRELRPRQEAQARKEHHDQGSLDPRQLPRSRHRRSSPLPRRRVTKRSAAPPGKSSPLPSGQRTLIRSTASSSPRPKCTRGSQETR